jgi:hypothetical protein
MLDLSRANPAIRSGRLFRTGADRDEPLPSGCVRIELRAPIELDTKRVSYPRAPHLWVPIEVPAEGHQGLTRMEYAYRDWLDGGAAIFRPILTAATSNHCVAIGCQQGIDRTGFVCAVLHLLCGTARSAILQEYLSCGSSTTISHHLELCLDAIAAVGGVDAYMKRTARCTTSLLVAFRSAVVK